MKEFFFISGLPRSGSTLLSGILKQNPSFYADISSPLKNLVASIIDTITNSEVANLIEEEQRKKLVIDFFEAYYKNIDKPVVFDTSRSWTAKTALLKKIYPDTKIICCVRDIPWILDSFELIGQHNSLFDTKSMRDQKGERMGDTLFQRCDNLMDHTKQGTIIRPYYWLEEGLLLNPDMIMLIEYEDLCKAPKETMQKIYEFINKPYFEHDFDNVEYKNEIYDRTINFRDLHTVRKKVSWIERRTILPSYVWEKYGGKEFWRKPKIKSLREVA